MRKVNSAVKSPVSGFSAVFTNGSICPLLFAKGNLLNDVWKIMSLDALNLVKLHVMTVTRLLKQGHDTLLSKAQSGFADRPYQSASFQLPVPVVVACLSLTP